MQLALAVVIAGRVVAAQGHWTDDGMRIVTDAVIATDDGQRVSVSQLGGIADGFGQITLPGPPLLDTGMSVQVDVHEARTLAGVSAWVVDDVRVDDLVASPDAPYVREGPTPGGSYLFWGSACIYMTYDDAGTAELAGDTEFPIIDAAILTWNTGVGACGYVKLKSAGRAAGHEVGKDYVNIIKFRDTKWCIPATTTELERCHADAAAGITTLTFIKHPGNGDDGQIVDADVELNGVNFAIATGGDSLGNAQCLADLSNTVTHELGHVIGLEHTCRVDQDPARVNGNGLAVPLCTMTSDPLITEATMFPYQACGETKKTSLSDDDLAGACAIYPKAKDPGTCEAYTTSTGCCDASGAPATGSAVAALFVLFVLRRRRPVSALPRR